MQENIHNILMSYVGNNMVDTVPYYTKPNKSQELIFYKKYFYKIYDEPICKAYFLNKVRDVLGNMYKSLGMTYEIKHFIKDGNVITIEKKEKIPIYGVDIKKDINDIYKAFYKQLRYVENNLEFSQIKNRMNEYNIQTLKIILSSVPKHMDFGDYNGHVILLDDESFEIVAFDENENYISFSPFLLNVGTQYIGTNTIFDQNQSNRLKETFYLSLYENDYSLTVSQKHIIEDIKLTSIKEQLHNDINIIDDISYLDMNQYLWWQK